MPPNQEPSLAEVLADDGPSAATERDLRTVRGAIKLVTSGIAVRVLLSDLDTPDAVATELQPEATSAGVHLHVDAGSGEYVMVVGPRRT